jgi:hypothetical protein
MSCSIQQLAGSMQALQIAAPVQKSETKIGLVSRFLSPLVHLKAKNFGDLKEIYEAILFSHQSLYKTLEAIQNMKLSEFDGLVGDCACQIRALFVARFVQIELSRRSQIIECKALQAMLLEKIILLKEKRAQIDGSNLLRPLKKPLSLEEVLKHDQLEVQVSKKLFIMNDAFFLNAAKSLQTVTQDVDGKKVFMVREITDETRVVAEVGPCCRVSMVIKEAKKRLAEVSVYFMQREGQALEDELTKKLLQNVKSIQGRKEISCIASVSVVFKAALQFDIPVLLKVRKARSVYENPRDPYDTILLFKPYEQENGTKSFVKAKCRKRDLDVPAIVIEAQRSDLSCQAETQEVYQRRLEQHDLLTLILLNAASHKQYSQEKEKLSPELQKPLDSLAEKARLLGCTQDVQKLMTITHIFCDTLSNQLVDLGRSERLSPAYF